MELNNSHLNYLWVKKEIKREIKELQEFNENEGTTYPMIQDTMKAMLGEKFITLRAYIKNLRNLTLANSQHTKKLQNKKQEILPGGVNRRKQSNSGQESIKLKQKEQYKERVKQRRSFLRKSTIQANPYINYLKDTEKIFKLTKLDAKRET